MNDKQKAKAIVWQIIISGYGEVHDRIRLSVLFYLVHKEYAKRYQDELRDFSYWPIIKKDHGPDIGRLEDIIKTLFDDIHKLEKGEIEIVDKIVKQTMEESTDSLCEKVRRESNSWNFIQIGEEMNIYHDLVDKVAFDKHREMDWMDKIFEEIEG